jgi:hypothetical protein
MSQENKVGRKLADVRRRAAARSERFAEVGRTVPAGTVLGGVAMARGVPWSQDAAGRPGRA